jgi:hypothetical protein
MLPYTLDNHFTFGYNSGTFNLQDASPTVDFTCSYSRAKYIPVSFKEECIKTAVNLSEEAKKLGRVPVILLSGGLDSHVVVKSFDEAGVNYHTATTRFANGYNDHELVYVEHLKTEHSFTHEYLDIDTESWLLSEEAMHMADQSLCSYPQMLPTMKLMKHVWDQGGMPVLGNGDFYAIRFINPVWRLHDKTAPKYIWKYIEYEYIVAWFRYAIVNGMVGGLGFFQHNPEIALAMGIEDHIVDMINGDDEGKQSTRSSKYLVYKKYWPSFQNRQKFHGGEKISGLCDMIRKNILLPKHSDFERKWDMDYFKFIDLLMPND